MKKIYQSILIVGLAIFTITTSVAQTPCENGMVAGYPCENVDLWAFVPFNEMGGGTYANDIWGWTDQASGREFALVGKNVGTAFVEITDPENPVYLGSLATHTENSTWRDIKTYQDHAFIVSEAGGHGMQVFDLSQLLTIDTPQIFEETAYYDGFGHSHNIAINEETGFAYSVGDNTFSGGLHILDISNPSNPTLAGGFSDDGYTHDCQAVVYTGPDTEYQGKEIVFAANEDNFAIVDVNDKTDCQLISSTTYTESGYTHQCWLTKDQRFLIFGDELDELYGYTDVTRTYVYNVEDLNNPFQVAIYEGPTPAIDHNLYTVGNMMYQSNYKAGVRIVDLGEIESGNLVERGYFDCYPQDNDPSFGGTWSNYPYFPSGNVILTNSGTGFFIIKPQIFHLTADIVQVDCYNNSAAFELTIPSELSSTNYTLSIEGLPGTPAISSPEINVPGTTNISITGFDELSEGITTFQIILNGDYGQYIIPASVEMIAPNPPSGLSVDNSTGTALFHWDEIAGATYSFIVSENEDLSNPIYTTETTSTTLELFDELGNQDGTTLYWNITATNPCGTSISETNNFIAWIWIGIDETISPKLTIFPNPTNGFITIKELRKDRLLQISDITGRIVWEDLLKPSSPTIDLTNLTPGVYFLQTPQKQLIEKIILN